MMRGFCLTVRIPPDRIFGNDNLPPRSAETSVNPTVKTCCAEALGVGPIRPGRAGPDAHLDLHAEVVRWRANEGAVEGNRVTRITHDRNGNEIAFANDAARRIE